MLVADVMEKYPETIHVFLCQKTSCVGCLMAVFDTLADVAKNYGFSVDDLIIRLETAVIEEQ
jgi:hybrid cluster-associated redox disulfide protein